MPTMPMIDASAYPGRRGSTERLAGLIAARLQRLRGPFRGLFQSEDVLQEEVVARVGAIEIRRIPAGWRLETSVKGDQDTARETALRRMAGYVARLAPSGRPLHTVRPLIQTREAPNRWRLSVAVAAMDSETAAIAASSGRVRLRTCLPITIAVMQVRGRPTPETVEDADARLREALAGTDWISTGGTILRLHRPLRILPFRSAFQVAVPVAGSGSP
jgi:SOUL heme-binding protein